MRHPEGLIIQSEPLNGATVRLLAGTGWDMTLRLRHGGRVFVGYLDGAPAVAGLLSLTGDGQARVQAAMLIRRRSAQALVEAMVDHLEDAARVLGYRCEQTHEERPFLPDRWVGLGAPGAAVHHHV